MGSIIEHIDRHYVLENLTPAPPFPDSIKIEITSRCNYRCKYCRSWRPGREVGDMDEGFLYRILKEAKSIGVKEIGLFLLGEPFLVDALPEYIRYAKEEVGIEYVFVTTNGSLCTPERLTAVIDAGLDSLKFSVNAGTRESYADIHGVDMFDQVVNNIEWLSKYMSDNHFKKPATAVSSILAGDLKEELDSFRERISPLVDETYYLPLYNQGGHIQTDEVVTHNLARVDNPIPPIPCWVLFNSCKISWDGWMTACCFDHDNSFRVADLHTTSLVDAWNDPKFVELRRRHIEKDQLEDSFCSRCLGLNNHSRQFLNSEVSEARSFLKLGRDDQINVTSPESLNDRHKGKRAFIIGTAPTIDDVNLSLMDNEITFGLNEIVTVFKPKYYVAVAPGCFIPPENALKASKSELVFLRAKIWPRFRDILNQAGMALPKEKRILFFQDNPKIRASYPILTHFKSDIVSVRGGASCLFSAIQFAYAMGCDPIYLVGISFKSSSQHYFKNSLKVKPVTEFNRALAQLTMRQMKNNIFNPSNRSLIGATPQNLFVEQRIIDEVDYNSLFNGV